MRVARLGLLGAATLVAAACGGAKSSFPEAAPPPAPAAQAHPFLPEAHLGVRQPPGLGAVRAGLARQGGSVALGRLADGKTIAYVADEDENALRTFDVEAHQERAATPLPGSPAQVMVL